jgi:hypothetical protein
MVRSTPFNYAVLAAFFLLSCSPASRLSRLVIRHPDLQKTSKTDTLWKVGNTFFDTTHITETDTFSINDTIYIRTADTFLFTAKCPTIRTKETIVIPSKKGKDSTQGRKRPVREARPQRPEKEPYIKRVMTRFNYLLFLLAGYALALLLNPIKRR